jgi:hypothetical protein
MISWFFIIVQFSNYFAGGVCCGGGVGAGGGVWLPPWSGGKMPNRNSPRTLALVGADIGLRINALVCGDVLLIKKFWYFGITAAALDFLEPVLVVLPSATVGIHQRS